MSSSLVFIAALLLCSSTLAFTDSREGHVDFTCCGNQQSTEAAMEDVITALWKASFPASFFTHSGRTPPASIPADSMARAIERKYVDYIGGRVIKTSLMGFPIIDPWGYDRDNGQGAMQAVRDELANTDAAQDCFHNSL